MKPRNLTPRILAVVLSACLIQPPHAYALRPQQHETEPQLTGLEEALRSSDPDALIRVASAHLAQWISPVSAAAPGLPVEGSSAVPIGRVRAGMEENPQAESNPPAVPIATLKEIAAGLTPEILSEVPTHLLNSPAILVVLAAGEGSRLGASIPKPAVKIHGKPMAKFAVDAARSLGIPVVVTVSAGGKDAVRQAIGEEGVVYVQDPRRLGTAAGVLAAETVLAGYRGTVLVAMGDMPWLEPAMFKKLLEVHQRSGAHATYLTAKVSNPSPSARILRLANGQFAGELQTGDLDSMVKRGDSITLKDSTTLSPQDLLAIDEVGTGTYAFNAQDFFEALKLVRNDNEKREFYLPSVLSILAGKGHKVSTVTITEDSAVSVDTQAGMRQTETLLAKRSLAVPLEDWTTSDWIAALDRAATLLQEPAVWDGLVGEGIPLADFLAASPAMNTPWHLLGLGVLAEWVSIYGPEPSRVEEEAKRYLRVVQDFEARYSLGPIQLFRAPGRGILMGGHNDYNWGPELLVTLPVDTLAVVRGRADTLVQMASTNSRFPDRHFDITQVLPPSKRGDWNRILEETGVPPFDWTNYVKGSILFWQNEYPKETLRGMDLLVDSTLPMERGISSSSALVVIAGEAIHHVNGKPVDKQHLAEACCFAEWYVGTRGGGLDHAISILGQRGQVLKLLPGSPEVTALPLPVGYHFVMADSLVVADKTGRVRNAFNQRSAETRLLGLALFKVRFPKYADRVQYLRDVTAQNLGVSESEIDAMVEQLPEAITTEALAREIPEAVAELGRSYQGLPEPPGGWRIRQRVRHIVHELRRMELAVEALQKTDGAAFGKLMDEAFVSYRDDYEIAVPELEELVGLARSVPGVLGANLQGGGFGGFSVILVKDEALQSLMDTLLERYYKPRGMSASEALRNALFVATPTRGSGLVRPQTTFSRAGLEEKELLWPETAPLALTNIEPIFIFQAAGGFGDAAYLVKLVDGFNARGVSPIVAVVGTQREQAVARAKLEQLKKNIPVSYTLWHEQNGRLVAEDGRPVAGERNLRPVLIQHFSLVGPDWARDTADRLVPQFFQPLYRKDQQGRFLLIGYSETGNVFGGYLKPDQGSFLNLYLTPPTVAGPHEPNPIYTGYLLDRQLQAFIQESLRLTRPQLRERALRQLIQVEGIKLSEKLIQVAKAKDNWALLYTSQGGSSPQMDALVQAFLQAKKSATLFTFYGDNPRLWYYPDHYWKPHKELVDHLKENANVSFVDFSEIFGSQERRRASILVINLPVVPLGTLRRLSVASDLLLAPGQNSLMEAVGMARARVGPKAIFPFPLYRLQEAIQQQLLQSIGATRTSEEVILFHHLRDPQLTQAEFKETVRRLASLLGSEEEQRRFQQDMGRLAALALQRSGNPSDGNLGNRILDLLIQADRGVPDRELITAPPQEITAIQQYQQRTVKTFRDGQEPLFPAFAGLEEPTAEKVEEALSDLGEGNAVRREAAVFTLSGWVRYIASKKFLVERAERLISAVAKNLRDAYSDYDGNAMDLLVVLAPYEVFHASINEVAIPAVSKNLRDPEASVRGNTQSLLVALAPYEVFHASMLKSGVIPASSENLRDPEGYIRRAAQQFLVALAPYEVFHASMESAGLTPAGLGYPAGLNWDGVSRQERANQALSSLPSYADLSLGGRAFIRRKLMRRASVDSEKDLLILGNRWLSHAVQLEALDQVAGLASAGAELHLPVVGNSVALERLADQLEAGVGSHHRMVPWILEGGGRQIDLRLLPAYPSVFRRLLAELLKDAALEKYSVVGAHYSVGLDLGKDLVPVALALYYGDENYLVTPVAGSAEGGVGFPGVWTYRGVSLDLKTGQVTDQNQSNFHLRPFRTFEGVIPLDLFQGDVDRLGWLASSAAAPAGDPRRQIYQDFLGKWESWVEGQGDAALREEVRAAEREVGGKTSAGVSPALDRASAALLAAIYKVPEKGTRARQELAVLLKQTLEKLKEAGWGSAAVARAIQSYREAESLEEMDRVLEKAVETVSREIFSAERDSVQESRLLETLQALDPETAQQVRDSLSGPDAGLEEGTKLTWKAWWATLGAWGPTRQALRRFSGSEQDHLQPYINRLVLLGSLSGFSWVQRLLREDLPLLLNALPVATEGSKEDFGVLKDLLEKLSDIPNLDLSGLSSETLAGLHTTVKKYRSQGLDFTIHYVPPIPEEAHRHWQEPSIYHSGGGWDSNTVAEPPDGYMLSPGKWQYVVDSPRVPARIEVIPAKQSGLEEGTAITKEMAAGIVRGWAALDETQRDQVIADLAEHGYTWEKYERHRDLILHGEQGQPAAFAAFPPVLDLGSRLDVLGKEGVIIAAGGEGTRLLENSIKAGLLPPDALTLYTKPTVPVMPVTGTSTLVYQLQTLADEAATLNVSLPVRVVLHEEVGTKVAEMIERSGGFGLPHLELVYAGMNAGLDSEGRIVLRDDGTVSMNPDGTGGVVRAALQNGGDRWFESILGADAHLVLLNGDMLLEPELIHLVAGAGQKTPVVGVGYAYPPERELNEDGTPGDHKAKLGTFAVLNQGGRQVAKIVEYRERGLVDGFNEAVQQAEAADGTVVQANSGLYGFPLDGLLAKTRSLQPHHQKDKDALGVTGEVQKVEEFATDIPAEYDASQVGVLSVDPAILTPIKDPAGLRKVREMAIARERQRAEALGITLSPDARVEFHPAMNRAGRVQIGQNVRADGAVGLYIYPGGVRLYTKFQAAKPWEPFDPAVFIDLFPTIPGQPVVIPAHLVFSAAGVATGLTVSSPVPTGLEETAGTRLQSPVTLSSVEALGLTIAAQRQLGGRENQEDALNGVPVLVAGVPVGHLFVVADGMGGHEGGEEASFAFVSGIPALLTGENRLRVDGMDLSDLLSPGAEPQLRSLVTRAFEGVATYIKEENPLQQSGTTGLMVLVSGGTAYAAWVGDTRLYLSRNQTLQLLTEDDAMGWNYLRAEVPDADNLEIARRYHALDLRGKNALSQDLGVKGVRNLNIHWLAIPLQPGDRLLLSTDGVHEAIKDEPAIGLALGTAASPEQAVERLMVLAQGGSDNRTAMVVDFAGPPATATSLTSPVTVSESGAVPLPVWLLELEERQLIVLAPAAAEQYTRLAGVVGQLRSVENLSFVILPEDQAVIDRLVAELAVDPTPMTVREFGVENDPWLDHFDKMAQGAFNILPRSPLEGADFRALMRQMLANLAGVQTEFISDQELDTVAVALGLASQV